MRWLVASNSSKLDLNAGSSWPTAPHSHHVPPRPEPTRAASALTQRTPHHNPSAAAYVVRRPYTAAPLRRSQRPLSAVSLSAQHTQHSRHERLPAASAAMTHGGAAAGCYGAAGGVSLREWEGHGGSGNGDGEEVLFHNDLDSEL